MLYLFIIYLQLVIYKKKRTAEKEQDLMELQDFISYAKMANRNLLRFFGEEMFEKAYGKKQLEEIKAGLDVDVVKIGQ